MKLSKRGYLKGLIPIFTVWLFAIYPVLALYAHNVDQLVLKQLFSPLIISFVLSTILFGLWLIILKNNIQAGLATVVLLIIFWYYGLFYTGITKMVNLKHWHLIPILFFIYFHLVYFITKIKQQKTLNNLNTILLLPISLLMLINFITILPSEFRKFNSLKNNPVIKQRTNKVIAGKCYPDIYLIILDEYASLKTIKEEWGYDNSAFSKFLKEQGFFIAQESKIRLPGTEKSMTTILNLEYVDENLTDIELYLKYNNNYLFSFLDRIGYKIVFLDGFGRPQNSLKLKSILHVYFEDIDFKHGNRLDEFSDMVIEQSMLSPIIKILKDENPNVYYQTNKYFFNYIKNYPFKVKESKKPTFLFAHINCPHIPYVFDRNGNFTENPTNFWEYKSLDKNFLKKLYLEQYIYVTKRITNIINEILEKSENKPIIILLSDHGPRNVSVGIENVKQFHRVLNAIYFPDFDYRNLYDSIAPVNTMRVVLNKYFGENYKMLEDK